MNINSNLSSMMAHESLLNTSAHNIANTNTENFARIETTISEKGKENVEAINTKSTNENPYSNTDLTKEITNQILSYHAVGANAVALETKSDTEKTLIDMYA